MSVARFPTLAHWGAYTALVENGRVVGCEPFAHDPEPYLRASAIRALDAHDVESGRAAWRTLRDDLGYTP